MWSVEEGVPTVSMSMGDGDRDSHKNGVCDGFAVDVGDGARD